MAAKYAIKHVFRSWHLFVALLIGIILATTFFAAIDIKANLAAGQALDQQLKGLNQDMEFATSLNSTDFGLAVQNITSISNVQSVDEVARFSLPVTVPSDNYSNPFYTTIVSFPNSSQIYNELVNRPAGGIGENQTYIVSGTNLAKEVSVGDNVTTMISFPNPKYYNTTTIIMNLTVAGFVDFTDKGYSLVSGSSVIYTLSAPGGMNSASGPILINGGYSNYRNDMMVISWENTLQKLWDNNTYGTVDVTFQINVNHDKLISPWNVGDSITKVQTVADDIQNNVLGNFLAHGSVNNMLGSALSQFQYNFSSTLLSFILVSIPVFFVAWYLGSTVSDVSFNLRRREIGLLSTKGLSSGQIQRMFLTEALAIGIIGGFLGVIGGLILNQYFASGVNLNTLFSPQLYSPVVMIITVIFGVLLALTSVFWSARKASRLPAVEALRDYVPDDAKKQHRKILPVIALILGSYKIVVFLLGINVQNSLGQLASNGGNFFLSIVSGPIVLFDAALTYIGPFLFFWGITKLLIRDTFWFQRLTSKIFSLMSDLGALAAKNVRRNPARLAAIAFLVALIIGFGVQVNAQTLSAKDYTFRQVSSQVGADVTVSVVNETKAPTIMNYILANVSGVQNASLQYEMSQSYLNTVMKVIDPTTWSTVAYHEDAWFSGNSMQEALKQMTDDGSTIILERSVAQQLNLKLYDNVTIDFASCPRDFKIVAFFGPGQSNSNPTKGSFTYTPPTWSYVPVQKFNFTTGSPLFNLESFQPTTILIKLKPGANGTQVAQTIRGLGLEIYGVDSFSEEWQQSQSLNNASTFGSLQVLDIENLGIVFAVLSASVGTALIAIVSLRERSREATLMSVRGLSYRQLVWMFLTESIAIITFAVVLGICVGLIMVYGSISTSNINLSQIVTMRLVFPPQFIETIAAYVALIYASTIGAIIVMTSQYVTKLEKMVRAR
jgi:ABC-type antimicrobial peptide transport system permease subunit